VPGVIFVNRKIKLNTPSIMDIVPTMLNYFGIARPECLAGRVLFENENK
jgi:bisphosphoglycerate-independent phosphoglycerate mutase (AlkP superfamily)